MADSEWIWDESSIFYKGCIYEEKRILEKGGYSALVRNYYDCNYMHMLAGNSEEASGIGNANVKR